MGNEILTFVGIGIEKINITVMEVLFFKKI